MSSVSRKVTALGAKKRDVIIRAAEQEFEKHGFSGARMQRIADIAGVPKANVHYYFSGKQALYDAVLTKVVDVWNQALSPISPGADPEQVLDQYVRMKVEFTRLYPEATRIFALELLQGGQHLSASIENETRKWTRDRAREIEGWIQQGKILPVDPYHLIFLIWSSTQQFAESETQIKSIYRRKRLSKKDYELLADSLTVMVKRICGLNTER
ncbi:MAG: TetR family transcriptional regulator C-terminal domain-containing protein [Acidiferrobacterales bacterium]|nr:TetR family transcriptional regulator C-terminal domain-containing protein [Acidiferrobacterales bacterium]